jgi:hypothetical protein
MSNAPTEKNIPNIGNDDHEPTAETAVISQGGEPMERVVTDNAPRATDTDFLSPVDFLSSTFLNHER